MIVSESYPTIHLGGLSNRILSEIGNVFSRTKTFCFENSVSHTWLMHTWGVSEGSRCGKG